MEAVGAEARPGGDPREEGGRAHLFIFAHPWSSGSSAGGASGGGSSTTAPRGSGSDFRSSLGDFADGFASPAETARESGYELASIVAASIPNSLSVTRSLSCPLSYRPSSYSDSDRRDAPAGRRTQSSSYAILGARRPPRRRGV